jgi:hypothetical protein
VYGGHRMGHRSTEYREEYEQNEMEQYRSLLVSTQVIKKILIKTNRSNKRNENKIQSFGIIKLVNKRKKK